MHLIVRVFYPAYCFYPSAFINSPSYIALQSVEFDSTCRAPRGDFIKSFPLISGPKRSQIAGTKSYTSNRRPALNNKELDDEQTLSFAEAINIAKGLSVAVAKDRG